MGRVVGVIKTLFNIEEDMREEGGVIIETLCMSRTINHGIL